MDESERALRLSKYSEGSPFQHPEKLERRLELPRSAPMWANLFTAIVDRSRTRLNDDVMEINKLLRGYAPRKFVSEHNLDLIERVIVENADRLWDVTPDDIDFSLKDMDRFRAGLPPERRTRRNSSMFRRGDRVSHMDGSGPFVFLMYPRGFDDDGDRMAVVDSDSGMSYTFKARDLQPFLQELVRRNPRRNPVEVVDEEFENPECEQCGGPGVHMGALGARNWFRCQNCGWEFSFRLPNPARRGRLSKRNPEPDAP